MGNFHVLHFYFSDITTLLSSSFGSFQIPVSQLLRPIILLSLLEKTTQLCKLVLEQNCVLQFDFWSLPLFKSHSDNCKTSFPTVSPLSLEAYFNSYFTEKIELIMDGLLKFPIPKIIFICVHSHFLPSGLRRKFSFSCSSLISPPGFVAYLLIFLQELHCISYSLSSLYL